MGVASAICIVGFLLTFVLPEPKQKSLEMIEQEGEQLDEKIETKTDRESAPSSPGSAALG